MSRSYQKIPISGNCFGSEKRAKQANHRAYRTKVRVSMKTLLDFDDYNLLEYGDVGDTWCWPKDGKCAYWSRKEASLRGEEWLAIWQAMMRK